MSALRAVLACSLLLAALSLPADALAAPDRNGVVSASAASFAWDSELGTGHNTGRDPKACSKDVETYCDTTLIKVDAADGQVGQLKVDLDNYFGPQCTPADGQNAPCDFSLWVYQSDAQGTPGKNVGSSINDSGEPETVTVKTVKAGYYLVVVYYYTVVQSSFSGTATLLNLSAPAPAVPVATPAVATPAPATITTALALSGKPSLRGGIPVRVTCTVACRGTVTAAVGRRVIGRATVVVDGASGKVVALRLSPKAAAKLRKGRGRVTLRVAVTDAAGARATATKTATIRLR